MAHETLSSADASLPPNQTTRKGPHPSDTPLISTPQDRRWCFPNDFDWADLIDRQVFLAGEVNLSGSA
jgi:hypothetical protein